MSRDMKIKKRALILRALLILQQSVLVNRVLILPAFTSDLTITPLSSQLDVKKFLLYWTEEQVRQPDFIFLAQNRSVSTVPISFSLTKNYDDMDGILDLSLSSLPLNLPSPSPEFEASIRDSIFWCSPPTAADARCTHHSRGLELTAELLFACGDNSNPPCVNQTIIQEKLLNRSVESTVASVEAVVTEKPPTPPPPPPQHEVLPGKI